MKRKNNREITEWTSFWFSFGTGVICTLITLKLMGQI